MHAGKSEGAFDSLNPLESRWFFFVASCVTMFSGWVIFSLASSFNNELDVTCTYPKRKQLFVYNNC